MVYASLQMHSLIWLMWLKSWGYLVTLALGAGHSNSTRLCWEANCGIDPAGVGQRPADGGYSRRDSNCQICSM